MWARRGNTSDSAACRGAAKAAIKARWTEKERQCIKKEGIRPSDKSERSANPREKTTLCVELLVRVDLFGALFQKGWPARCPAGGEHLEGRRNAEAIRTRRLVARDQERVVGQVGDHQVKVVILPWEIKT